MKAITIRQPYASLIVYKEKEFETRSWRTQYRGPIAIHAAAKHDDDAKIFSIDAKIIENYDEMPLGKIIAIAKLVDCHKIVRYGGRGLDSESPGWLDTERGIYIPSSKELMLGDWTPGRYAWEFSSIKVISPIFAKGKQRLWDWKEELNK